MSSLDLFLPLAKVDLDRRLVTGVATAETPDRSGEICDYASSKPYFEKWSAEALGGERRQVARRGARHARPIAAGKLTDIAFDDEAKRVVVAAKIVDDDEWRKVTEGVYTGFRQGGRYVKRWPDPDTGLVRYTAEPHEISLVDLPCLPDATFEVVKDGVVEKRAFAARPQLATRRRQRRRRPRRATLRSKPRKPSTRPPPRSPRPRAGSSGRKTKTCACARRSTPSRRRSPISQSASRRSRPSRCPPRPRCGRSPRAPTERRKPLGADDAIRRLAALPPEARALALTKLSLDQSAALLSGVSARRA